MIETHPFKPFVPPDAKYLILGSFTGKQATKASPAYDAAYDWYYGTRTNQFWLILEKVYGIELRDKEDKQALFDRLHIAISDIIYQCERKENSNLDGNLTNITYNIKAIKKILRSNPILKIFFTSRFVEQRFKKEFKEIINRYPAIECIPLPSPSPRYARISKEEKIRRYKELLPMEKK